MFWRQIEITPLKVDKSEERKAIGIIYDNIFNRECASECNKSFILCLIISGVAALGLIQIYAGALAKGRVILILPKLFYKYNDR